MHDRAAQRILAQDPSIAARQHLHRDRVRRSSGGRAHPRRASGSRARPAAVPAAGRRSCIWPTRGLRTRPTLEHALPIARLLLDHGADPNDFYMAGDARYTVLVGVAGEGEQDSPRQPYAAALVRAAARARRGAVRHSGALQHAFQRRHAVVARAGLQAHHQYAAWSGMDAIPTGRCSTWAPTDPAPAFVLETAVKNAIWCWRNGRWRAARIPTRSPPATSGFPSAVCMSSPQ